MQPLSLEAISHAFSADRLNAYRQPGDADDLDKMARYMWNMALACALHPPLHVLEVTFRNVIYTGSVRVLSSRKLTFDEIPCWLDATPSLLMPQERAAVEDVKERLRKRGSRRYMAPGYLVGKLGFGFWTALCNAPYEQARRAGPGLWPEILKYTFVVAPKQVRNRPTIQHRFNEIRDLRNRISHHEPVWDWDLPAWHAKIVEALSWMNMAAAGAVQRESALDVVYRAGPAAFRPRAEALFGR
jgi:hypothetical protein